MLGGSAVLLTSLLIALLALEGRGLPDRQLFGMLFAGLLSGVLTVLVFRAKTFQGAARAYIAVLAVAVIGSLAAAAATARMGDIAGLAASIIGALVCASQAVARLGAPEQDDAIISASAITAFESLVEKTRADVAEALQALSEASDFSEPYVLERLAQLQKRVSYAEEWSKRLKLPAHAPARRQLSSVRRRLARG